MAKLEPARISATVQAIDAALERAASSRRSRRLGASIAGDDCDRKLWYAFRWAHEEEKFDGRTLRIFESGNAYEARAIAWLEAAGIVVTDAQREVTFCDGHVVGKIDGIASGLPEAAKTPHLLEVKTHNVKSFSGISRNGVKQGKPLHYAQMQLYMYGLGLTRALYFSVCKDTDEIYCERVEYDFQFCALLITRLDRIVKADKPPPRLHDDPSAKGAWQCTYCPSREICIGEFSWRSCRTCIHSTPTSGGKWRCARHEKVLTVQEQEAGCEHHRFIPDLVPGEQTDVAHHGEVIDPVIVYEVDRGGKRPWLDTGGEV